MRITNRRAKFDYQILEKFETGISLSGGEAKAVRTGHANLTNSFAKIMNREMYLINVSIPVQGARNYDPTRTRKLLLHKSQIISIESKVKQKKLTLVPVSVYTKGRLIKIELALAKSKRKFEKKESLKKKDILREIEIEFRGRSVST
ncbi:SsrA-binding protein SmpB [Candidatus Woesebacteria bacterium]|nr:SsrA-binding protein SmpB [Candidatus Woesebacteria bacterium]